MKIVSTSPLTVASLLWQSRPDRWTLTVVCKATFLLRQGLSPLAPEQEPPRPHDVYWRNDERRSLVFAGDLVPFKRYPEVLFTGSAYAPGGAHVTSIRVRLAIGRMDKRIDVFGDRFFNHAGELTAPSPFVRMPLAWERAAGGPGTPNPVGVRMGAAAVSDAWGRVPVPNLQLPGRSPAVRSDVIEPIGLGPIAPHWPTRAARLPAHVRAWDSRRWAEQALPSGFDPWFFNAAPDEQELPELGGGERLVLEHLHPEHAKLETSLEQIAPRATVTRPSGERADVELRCDTLAIDTDRGQASLTWRGHVALDDPHTAGWVLVTLNRSEPAAGGSERPRETPPPAEAVTMAPPGVPSLFPNAPSSVAPPSAPRRSSSLPALGGSAADVGDPSATPFIQVAPPLSFAQARRGFAIIDEETMTDEGAMLSDEHRALVETLIPMLGSAPSAPEPEEPTEITRAPEFASEPLSQPELPIERSAAIAASLSRRPERAEELLAEHRLDFPAWDAHRRRWDDAIRAEIALGRSALLRAHDAAFVAQLERERGPIDAQQYARLVVATERGTRDDALAALSLPREAMLPIERVYLARTLEDPKLRASVRAAIAAARRQTG